jgi:hypothetical protein
MSADETKGVPPRKVILFSGHMIDAPDREKPRFPANKEAVAANAIVAALEALGAGAGDLCICGGACGGDLLFAEAALARGARPELYIPFEETTFLLKSVDFANRDWRARFLAAKSHASVLVLPLERGATPENRDPYEQNNLWMLQAATRFGVQKVEFICLWNGKQGDGPGGTRHLMEEVRRGSGRVHWLDITKLSN